jgi:hypothetical protein
MTQYTICIHHVSIRLNIVVSRKMLTCILKAPVSNLNSDIKCSEYFRLYTQILDSSLSSTVVAYFRILSNSLFTVIWPFDAL